MASKLGWMAPPSRRFWTAGVSAAVAVVVAFGLRLAGSVAAAPAEISPSIRVELVNPLAEPRPSETVSLPIAELQKRLPGLDPKQTVVTDAAGNPVLSQWMDLDGDDKPEALVFQVSLGPSEAQIVTVRPGPRAEVDRAQYRVYGRFARERHDDFAWENDRIAHRMYGPDLETWKAEPLVSSGVDVWCKRVRRLVVNDWYLTDNYHQDTGEGGDFYSVGKSRGCGGLGVWTASRSLAVSRNFTNSRVLASGPVRLVFELSYAPWDIGGGRRISEVKRVTLDAGHNFDHFASTFRVEPSGAGAGGGNGNGSASTSTSTTGAGTGLSVAVGIARHEGGVIEVDAAAGWARGWEPLKTHTKPKPTTTKPTTTTTTTATGPQNLGCAVLATPGSVVEAPRTETDQLLVLKARAGVPFEYDAGTGWDGNGDFPDRAAWGAAVEALARRRAHPVAVHLSVVERTKAERSPAIPGDPRKGLGQVGLARFDVRDFGALADGKTKCTEAVRQAIAAARAQGGGTVFFGPGEYLTGPIRLESHITLHIDAGARVRFSDDFEDYLPMVRSRWEGTEVLNFSPLIYAEHAEDIAIEGSGTLDGQGQRWWQFYRGLRAEQKKTGVLPTDSRWQKEFAARNPAIELPDDASLLKAGFLRPPFVQFLDSRRVSIRDVKLTNSPFWTINPVYCDDVTVRGVTIVNPPDAPNTDGIDPESCRNVRISDCLIDTGDDCITIKSGRDRQGRRINRPAENTTITNCTMLHGHGGVVIGSEMSGGVRNLVASNCVFDGTDRGIRIKSTRGRGGLVENVRMNNIVMRNIVEEAITVDLSYTSVPPEPVSERTPHFRNIRISGVSGKAGRAGLLQGLPESPLEDIGLVDVDLEVRAGLVVKDVRNLSLTGVKVNTEAGPALSFTRVASLSLADVGSRTPHPRTPVVELTDVDGALVRGCFPGRGTDTFARVAGRGTRGVVFEGNALSAAGVPVQILGDVGRGAVAVPGPPPARAPEAR